MTGPAESDSDPTVRTPVDRVALRRRVVALAVPITIGNLSHTVVSYADTFMVGKLGEIPLAALGASAVLFLSIFLVFSAIFTGVQVLAARRHGEGSFHATGRVLTNALAVGLGAGAISSILGLTLPHHVMPLFSADPEVQRIGAEYLQYRWGGGLWLVILVFVFKGFYWGIGNTRVDLMVSLVVNTLNIGLNYMLIWGELGAPQMGAPGAGLASALSNLVAVVIYATLAARREFRLEHGTFARGSLDRKIAGSIMRLSIPRSIQALAFSVSSLPFFGIIGQRVGDEALAASAVIWRFFGLNVLVAIGVGTAVATLVGQNLGRRDPDRAEAYGWTGMRVAMVAVGILSAVCFILAQPILIAFSPRPRHRRRGDPRVPSHARVSDQSTRSASSSHAPSPAPAWCGT